MAHYELIVIGAGPGGYEAALHAAKLGKKVAVVEKREAGGTCLNRGCIPTKTLLHSSQIFHDAKHGAHAGIHTDDIRADMTEIFAYKREISQKLSSGIESLFKTAKIDFLRGTALITAPGAVRVTDPAPFVRAIKHAYAAAKTAALLSKRKETLWLIINSSSSAPVPAATRLIVSARQAGQKVAVVERREAGGTCLNRGRDPDQKTLLHALCYLPRREERRALRRGHPHRGYPCRHGWKFCLQARRFAKASSGIESLFKSAKIDLLRGTAPITAPGAVVRDGRGRQCQRLHLQRYPHRHRLRPVPPADSRT